MTAREVAEKILAEVDKNSYADGHLIPFIAAELEAFAAEQYANGRMSERLECQRTLDDAKAEGYKAGLEAAAKICDVRLEWEEISAAGVTGEALHLNQVAMLVIKELAEEIRALAVEEGK